MSEVERADSGYLLNTFTGLQNKLESMKAGGVSSDALYETSGLFQRIIDTYPLEAYNLGFQLIGGNADRETQFLNDLGCYEAFKLASISARLRGASAVLMGYADNLPLDIPARLGRPIRWLKVYSVTDTEPDDQGCVVIGEDKCHISRLLFFYGRKTVKQSRRGNLIESGEPILRGIEDILVSYINNAPYLPALIRLSNQVTLGTKGLAAAIKKDVLTKSDSARQEILLRLQALNHGRDVSNTLAYDLDGETVEVKSLSLSGIDQIMEETELVLSYHLDYPRNKLFDRGSTAGLTTSTNAQIIYRLQWATQLSKWIDNNWTRPLEILCQNLGFSSEVFIPLALQLTIIEQAEIDKLNIENLKTLRDSGVISDLEFRDMAKQLTKLPFSDTQESPLGAIPGVEMRSDSSSLVDILNDLTKVSDTDIDSVMLEIGKQSQPVTE